MGLPTSFSSLIRLLSVFLLANSSFHCAAAPILESSGDAVHTPSLVSSYVVTAINKSTPFLHQQSEAFHNITHDEWKRGDDVPCFIHNFVCCFSCCQPSPGEDGNELQPWTCTGQIPSLDEMKQQIDNHGQVASKTSVFYTRLSGPSAMQQAKCWFDQHLIDGITSEQTVYFNDVIDEGYNKAVGNAILRGPRPDVNQQRFQKLLSQAFAERARGTVWVFMPGGLDPPSGATLEDMNTWKSWEYPALTRNTQVDKIVRVDPTVDNQHTPIWKRSDGASPNPPLGTNWPPQLQY